MDTGIADIPFEIFYNILEKTDYPTIKRICDSNRDFRKMCLTPYFKKLIDDKRRKYLLENEEYTDMLYRAINNNNIEEVKDLVELGIDLNPKGRIISPLMVAVRKENEELVQFLLEKAADPNVRDDYGFTPLHQASSESGGSMVELLLEYSADPTIQNEYGNTPLDIAISEGNFENASILREAISIYFE